MKALGIGFVVLAILIAVIPAFNNCGFEGKAIVAQGGKLVPMKCFWTARAAIGTAIPLAAVGLMLAFSRRRETQKALAVAGGLLSAVAIALPTVLIGVCAMAANCVSVMRPSLILLGTIGMALGLTTGVTAHRRGSIEGVKSAGRDLAEERSA